MTGLEKFGSNPKDAIEKPSEEREMLAALESSGNYLFHGTGNSDIEVFTPRQAFDRQRGLDGPPAVFASPAADYAIFMAVATPLGHTATSSEIEDDAHLTFKFKASQNVLRRLKEEEHFGFVYVFDKAEFIMHNDNPTEFKNLRDVTPIQKIRVSSRDLPKNISVIGS